MKRCRPTVANQAPETTAASRLFIRLIKGSARVSQRRALYLIVAAFTAAAVLDVATGTTVSPVLPYILAIALASWFLKEAAGLCAAAFTAGMLLLFNGWGVAAAAEMPWISLAWNNFARLAALSIFAVIVNALRTAVELERWRSSTDSLTGALNKAGFNDRIEKAIQAARESDAAILLAYMDLDGFKAINDAHGHSAGDKVLATFAAGAVQSIRKGDLFARIGGDEFVAMLVVGSPAEADSIAKTLHPRLSSVLRDTGFPVTCSIGALVIDSRALDESENLIELADQLMYEAKRSGKNALRLVGMDILGSAIRPGVPIQVAAPFDGLPRTTASFAVGRRFRRAA